MSIRYFVVQPDSRVVPTDFDSVFTDQLLGQTVYKVNRDIVNMTQEEICEYLSAYDKNPQDFVEMSGISVYQKA